MTSTSALGLDNPNGDRTPNRSHGSPVTIELQCRSGEDDTSQIIRPLDTRSPMSSSSDGCNHNDDYLDEEMLPVELHKTVSCFLLMLAVFLANLFSMTIIHDRAPEQRNSTLLYPPLRDITFDVSADLVARNAPLLWIVSEIILVGTTVCVAGVLIFHAHRSIVLRRFFFLLSLLFSLRLVTMNATVLPVSDGTLYHCDAKNRPIILSILLSRFAEMASRLGLWLREDIQYCGNFVYSGHTVLLVMNCLMADEYSPSIVLNVALRSLTACSMLFILMCRFDYTISLITAYYVTTRVFWIYHTFANNPSLKERDRLNQICKEWWYPVFRYLEGNVKTVVPNRYSKFFNCDNRF